jgi:hypothetical protein
MTNSHDQNNSDTPKELTTRSSRQRRVKRLWKLAIGYLRQSTQGHVPDNVGSGDAQRELVALARQWGWPEARISRFDSDLGFIRTSSFLNSGPLDRTDPDGPGQSSDHHDTSNSGGTQR